VRRRKKRRRSPAAGVSAGDVLLACHDLNPTDDRTLELILKMLGLEPPPPSMQGRGTWSRNVSEEMVPPVPPIEAARGSTPPPTTPRLPPQLPGTRATAEHIGKVTFAASPSTSSGGVFRPAAGLSDSAPPPPIFARGTSRALLSAALATQREGSDLDVDRATTTMATEFRLDKIPYRLVPTLRRGAQVLIDESDAMHPFRHDVGHLLEDLDRLFGRGHLIVRRFAHCPERGVRQNDRSRREAWEPPARGAPVAVVSNLGLTPGADLEAAAPLSEWHAFGVRVRESGCPLVALVPINPLRWPLWLQRTITFIHWSERTTARQIARALRDSRRRFEEAR
jgi:hypothetical protein